MNTSAALRPSVDFMCIAQELMFTGRLHLAKHRLVYRKGKTADDVRAALRKACDPKNGQAKTETELGMLELYLKQVFLLTSQRPTAPTHIA